jgi:hypothetical protein
VPQADATWAIPDWSRRPLDPRNGGPGGIAAQRVLYVRAPRSLSCGLFGACMTCGPQMVPREVVGVVHWMPQKAQNAGSITFKSTIMGDVLDGTWSGLDESQNIGYAPCTWVRIRKRDFPKEDLLQFATAINAALIVIPTRWRHKNTPLRKSVIYKVNASSSKHMISGEIAREIASRKGQSSSLNSGPGLARSVGTAQPDGFAETENDKRVSGSDTA